MNKILTIIITLFTLTTLTSCSSTYYLGQFDIYVGNDKLNSQKEALVNIQQIAHSNSLELDIRASNEDTLSFFGPPYHYIQFYFDNKTKHDSLVIKLNYDGRLASQTSTDKIYFNLIRQLDSIYNDKIIFTQLEKR